MRHEFGPFCLDSDKQVLWRGSEIVPLTPKALALLSALIRAGGDVATRKDLLAEMWPDAAVEESNLTVTVGMLRRALGNQPDGRSYVETVPRRGYRFGAKVALPPTAPLSLAVLPLRCLGSDLEAHLGLVLADALIGRLTAATDLLIRPTGAVVRFVEAPRPPLEAAAELKVDAVIDGLVHRDGDRLRVSLQLVPRSQAFKPWADSFEASVAGLFSLQDAVTERIVGALERHLVPAPTRHVPKPEAYEAYLRGRYFWVRLQPRDIGEALACYGQAAQLDPDFAAPHAGLADVYQLFPFAGLLEPRKAWDLAAECAERALARDPDLAEAHLSLAWTVLFRDWDWAAARARLDRALSLSPGAAFAHLWKGLFLLARGEGREAAEALERARDRDPLSAFGLFFSGIERAAGGDREGQMELTRSAVQLRPDHLLAHWSLGEACLAVGLAEEAEAAHRRALELTSGGPAMKAALACTLATIGKPDAARALLDELDANAEASPISAYQRGAILGALGQPGPALDRLEEAAEAREPWVVFLGIDPTLAPLREEPRFRALLRRVL
ncbi:MAG: winged helix-turn-helix domain-containing protein, partial [Vicinamibacteria bacterium]